VNIDELMDKPILPSVCIFDIAVYRSEMPIIGYRPLSEKEKEIPFPSEPVMLKKGLYALKWVNMPE